MSISLGDQNPATNGSTALARCLSVAAVLVLALALPSPASAHLRTGTVAVDYAVTVTRPVTAAYRVRIYQSDQGIRLTVEPGHTVVVLGDLGEPFLRLDGAGVAVNLASPTAEGAKLVSAAEHVAGRASAWRLRTSRHTVVWHDARVRSLPLGLRRGRWRVPLLVDGRRGALSGEIVRLPRPSLWPWLGELALAAAAAGALLRLGAAARGAIALGVLAALGALVTCAVFALDRYASPGTWILGADGAAFVLAGLAVLRWGPAQARVAAAGGVGLVALALALSKGAVFTHPIVLAVLAATPTRLAVATAAAAGLADSVLAGVHYARRYW